MTTHEWLRKTHIEFTNSGIATARLDSLVLLEDATGKDRSWLLAHPEHELEPNTTKILSRQVKRRAGHEPLSYIRGKSEFYGREFKVTPETLEPRPETETMIELLKQQVDTLQVTGYSKLQIVDVGTGSGCLAITAKKLFPAAKVYATEINQKAMKIAKQNAKIHQTDITFFKGNLLSEVYELQKVNDRSLFVVLANLPYVPDKYELNSAAKHEPKLAIFGGVDGLDLYRQMFLQINSSKSHGRDNRQNLRPMLVFTESLPFQHQELGKIAKLAGYKLAQTSDFIQVFKLSR